MATGEEMAKERLVNVAKHASKVVSEAKNPSRVEDAKDAIAYAVFLAKEAGVPQEDIDKILEQ